MRVLRHWCGLLSSSVFRSAASHRGVHWTAIQRPGHLTDNCKMVYFKLPAHSPHKRTIAMWSARCDILFKELYFHDRRCLVFGVGFFEIHFTPMLCSSVPLLIKPLFFCAIYFLEMEAIAEKIRPVTCKPAYWVTFIGRFVLFWVFQSAKSCRISHLENKNPSIAV